MQRHYLKNIDCFGATAYLTMGKGNNDDKNFDKKKGHIQKVWVKYYKKTPDSHANKKLFIPLLSDYFKEFDTKEMLAELAKGNTNFK